MRVVLYTNVVLSLLLFRTGRLSWIVQAISNQSVCPLVSRSTVLELMRVLAYPKFKLSQNEITDLLSEYLPFCEVVDVEGPFSLPYCRGPNDIQFLELGVAGTADAIVTGDSDLLDIRDDFDIPILHPSELKDRLKPQK